MPVSISPASGSGYGPVSITAAVRFSNTGNRLVRMLINDHLLTMGACWFVYSQAANAIILYRPDYTGLPTGSVTLGPTATGTVENTKCRIHAQGSSFADGGLTGTLTARVEFLGGFEGNRVVWASAANSGGESGWQALGTRKVGGVGDVTPPVISGLDPIESSASAYVSWSTNEPADTQVRYGLTAAYGGLVSDPTLTGTHSPLLSGLQAGSLYYYEVVSRDASGNQATASGTFETSEGTSHSISSSPPQASSPCDTGSVLIEKSVTVERISNNLVRLKARTWLSKAAGTDWRNYFVPIVRARPRLNSVFLGTERIATGTWNGYAEYTWDFNIQATGTGVYAVDSDHYGNSSYCNGLYPGQIVYNHFAGTDQRTILRPARPDYLSGASPAKYLGGAIVSGTYQNWTTLVLGNANGATGTPTWIVSAGATHGTLSCSQCNSNTYTATQASPSCNYHNVLVRVSYDGLLSDPMYIYNDAPAELDPDPVVITTDTGPPTGPATGPTGWLTEKRFQVLNLCRQPMGEVMVNESFTNRRYGPQYQNSNWPLSWPNGVWGDEPSEFVGGFFTDYLWEVEFPGRTPPVMPADSNGSDESDASTVTLHDQHFKGGPSTPGTGISLLTVTQIHYLDHGGHR